MKKVLITGGSGLLGSKITELLLENNISVAHLSTQKKYSKDGVACYYWNPSAKELDEQAFEGVDTIIHLAGAGIADKRWTAKRKLEILESRVASSTLLSNFLQTKTHSVTKFIAASAVGFYGNQTQLLTEDLPAGNDFLAHVCSEWEACYTWDPNKIATVILRIGIVLAKEGGALPEMTKTLPFFIGIMGSGKQVYSWIHIDDLAKQFLFAGKQAAVQGVYNAVAPNPRTQIAMAHIIADKKGIFAIPAPKLALQMALGEMSTVLFLSQQCSAQKMLDAGFTFQFENLEDAIDDLL